MIRLCFFYVLTVHAELFISTEWNTNGHCYGNDANATLRYNKWVLVVVVSRQVKIKINSVDHCQRQVASYISEEVVAPGDYAPQYRTTIIRWGTNRKPNRPMCQKIQSYNRHLRWEGRLKAKVEDVECNCRRRRVYQLFATWAAPGATWEWVYLVYLSRRGCGWAGPFPR